MTSFYKLQGSNVVVDPTTNVTKLPRSEPMARCHEPWRASNATAREKTEPALDKPRRRLPIPEGMLRTVSDYGPCSRFSTMGPTSGQEQADKSPFVCSSFTRRDDTHCSIVSTPTSQDDDSCYSPMSLPQTRQEHTCCPPVATSAAREKPAAVARRIHTSLKPEEARPLDPSEIQAQRKEQHRLTEEIRRYKERKTYTRALNGPLSKLSACGKVLEIQWTGQTCSRSLSTSPNSIRTFWKMSTLAFPGFKNSSRITRRSIFHFRLSGR